VNRTFKVIILAVVFSFLWGAWWGFYSLERKKPRSQRGDALRVLAQKGVFPRSFIEKFEDQSGVRWELTEKTSEMELLREALSHNKQYDLISIPSYIAKSFLIDNVFLPLDLSEISQLPEVSVDFKNLDFDPDNRHLLPLTWGLNGFLINSKTLSLSSEDFSEIFMEKAKVSILPSPTEIFSLALKMKPIIKTWVETGQAEELQKDLKPLASKLTIVRADPREELKNEKLQAGQMTNGQAATWVGVGSTFRFVLPRERATLWLTLIGVSRGAKDPDLAHQILNQLLKEEAQVQLVKANEHAAVRQKIAEESLPLLQRAEFIRQVPLSRVELFIHHEALEPTWIQAIKKEWPETFKDTN
jgi:spermidine/putrescine transport system substrate-binding protein